MTITVQTMTMAAIASTLRCMLRSRGVSAWAFLAHGSGPWALAQLQGGTAGWFKVRSSMGGKSCGHAQQL